LWAQSIELWGYCFILIKKNNKSVSHYKKPFACYYYYDPKAGSVCVKNIETQAGLSLLELAHHHDIPIPSSCGGNKACSTCHVILDAQSYDVLQKNTEVDEEELSLLDELPQRSVFSRLCCQLYPSGNGEKTMRIVVPVKKASLLSGFIAHEWGDYATIIGFLKKFSFLKEDSTHHDFVLTQEHIGDLQETYQSFVPAYPCNQEDLNQLNDLLKV
jgi:ferredoxin